MSCNQDLEQNYEDQDTGDGSSSGRRFSKMPKGPVNAGVYKHKCEHCDSTFQKLEHLRRHERSHTKERPFICPDCGKKFTRADSLVRHARLHDGTKGKKVIDSNTKTEESSPDGTVVSSRKDLGIMAPPTAGGTSRPRPISASTGTDSHNQQYHPSRLGHDTPLQDDRDLDKGSYQESHLGETDSRYEPGFASPYKRQRVRITPEPLFHREPSRFDHFRSTSDFSSRGPELHNVSHAHSESDLSRGPQGDSRSTMVYHPHDDEHMQYPSSAPQQAYRHSGTTDFAQYQTAATRDTDHQANIYNRYYGDQNLSGGGYDHMTASSSSAGQAPAYAEDHIRPPDAYSNNHLAIPVSTRLPPFHHLRENRRNPTGAAGPSSFEGFNDHLNQTASTMHARPSTSNPSLHHGVGKSDYDGASSPGNDMGFNFDPNAYGFPAGFGQDGTSDVDLLSFLATDNSMAFAHTLIPEYTTFTRPSSPSSKTTPGAPLPTSFHSTNDGSRSAECTEPSNPLEGMLPHVPLSPKMAALWRNVMAPNPQSSSRLATVQAGPMAPRQSPSSNGTSAASRLNKLDTSFGDPHKTRSVSDVSKSEPRWQAEGGEDDKQSTAFTTSEREVAGFQLSELRGTGVHSRQSSGSGPPLFETNGTGRPQQAITEAKHLISELSFHLSASTSPLSSTFLDRCLKLFFTRFLPTLPVIHQPTWNVTSACGPLIINMIALGSLYLPDQDDRAKGEALWRLVYKGVCVSWDRLIKLRNGPADPTRGTPLCQTILFGQIFAVMSKRLSLRASPYTFQGLGLRIARISGMFRNPRAAADDFLPTNPDCTPAELDLAFRVWAAYESQLRTVLGLYMLEGQYIHLYRVPPTTSHLSNPLVGACDDELFNAPHAEAWKAILQRRNFENRRQNTFATIYKRIWDDSQPEREEDLSMQLPSMSKGVLFVAMHSVISQLRETRAQGLTHDRRSPLDFHLGFKRLHKILLTNTNDSNLEKACLRISWHYTYIEYLLVDTVSPQDLVASADMPLGCPDILPVADTKFRWTTTPVGRRIFLHANAIRRLASYLPFHDMQLPRWFLPPHLYCAALVLVAYVQGTRLNAEGMGKGPAYDLAKDTDLEHLDTILSEVDQTATTAQTFINQGGPALIEGNPFQLQDIQCFTGWLRKMGVTFGFADVLADDIEYRIK